ncbi:MAG: hypothetical protein NVS2B14_00330 [Chamaesiphon sp.]
MKLIEARGKFVAQEKQVWYYANGGACALISDCRLKATAKNLAEQLNQMLNPNVS